MNEELKAVIAHHITIMMEAQSQPGPGGSGGGGPETKPNEKPDPDKGANKKTALGGLRKLTGISLTAAGLLKQSQVFTGVIGSIFQLFGAMIDVILAPLLPIMLPAIKFMASLIPIISEKAKIVASKIIGVVSTLGDFYSWVMGKLEEWGWLSGGEESIKNAVKNAIAIGIVGAFWLKIFGLWGLAKTWAIGALKGAWLVIKTEFKSAFAIIKSLGKGLRYIGGQVYKFLNFMTKGKFGEFITKAKEFFGKVTRMLSKIPGVGMVKDAIKGVAGKVGGLFAKDAAGKMAFKTAFRGLAATPVLGAAVTAAFGAVDTARAFKEHGMQAGLATGLAAVAGTAVSLLPVPGAGILGMVVQKGGAVAAEKLLSDKVTITNNVMMYDKDGRETTAQWTAEQDAKGQHEMSIDASAGLYATG